MKIVLVGYMGSGKSSVGKKLAEKLKIPFMDMDTEIEKQQGISVSEVFRTKGEIYFRTIENKILKELISQLEKFVLAIGGGTPCYADSMAYMASKEDVKTIYLKTSLSTLTSRLLNEKDKRPLLAHLKTEEDLNDFIRKHLFERAYYYNQSKIVIENNSEALDDTVERIVSKLF